MKLYRLSILPDPTDPEGEDHDEWFSSLRAAKKRRSGLLREGACSRDVPDLEITENELADVPERQLLLRVLNRCGFIAREKVVVPGVTLPRRDDNEDE